MKYKRTKIVCTMGPATQDDELLAELIKGGMNVARFNFSHGDHESQKTNIERVRRVSDKLGIPVAIMLDTKGPEIRTGRLEGGSLELTRGQRIILAHGDFVGNSKRISIDYPTLHEELWDGCIIMLDDGLISLKVYQIDRTELFCIVQNGGTLGEHKGVNCPGIALKLPLVTDRDREDIMFGCDMDIDVIAASFTRNADTVRQIREICRECGRPDIPIYSKIENFEGLDHFEEILEVADGIMVARGDLGVELPIQEVPHIQKDLIRKCNEAYKPVITATQLLDSMIRNPRPTRAEVNDVANAIYDGTDCVMLSGETAAGKYPLEALQMMTSICLETERFVPRRREYYNREGLGKVNGSIGHAAVNCAEAVGAKCIIAPTRSGRSARLISSFRPDLPIIASSPDEHAIRRSCLYWGVHGYLSTMQASLGSTIRGALQIVQENGYAEQGDLVVITAGDPGTAPRTEDYITSTNLCMVAQIK